MHWLPALLLAPVLAAAAAPDLPRLELPRAASPPVIDGRLDDATWADAAVVDSLRMPWWTSGEREGTRVQLAWDDTALYVAFQARDRHIWATLAERDAPVSRDDCVEVFIAPDTAAVGVYFNFEINALGTILDRSPRDGRSGDWNAAGLRVAIAIDGTLNEDGDEDRGWVAEIALPFADLAPFAPRLPPVPGDVWRLNLYRIGGRVNPQFSAWSDTGTPEPQYHVPARFGIVRFAGRD